MRKRYVPVNLTPDAAINRKALGPDVLDNIRRFEEGLGCKMKLIKLRVAQGSEAAKRVSDAHIEYNNQDKNK